ncbi:helix-turn-helix domain-containing protein [Nakamurella silvestris]|nr:helix-turn-helix domain-containing protein [Nakamurella silvestris]
MTPFVTTDDPARITLSGTPRVQRIVATGREGLRTLNPLDDLVTPNPDGFAAELSSSQLGPVLLSVLDTSPVLMDRGPARIAARPSRDLHLELVIDGHANLTQQGRTVQCGPGQMAFRNTAEPYTLVVPRPSRFVQVAIPFTALGQHIRGIGHVTAVRLGSSPLVQATSHLLQMLGAALPHPGTRSAHHAERAIVDITTAVIDELKSAAEVHLSDAELRHKISLFVAQNVHNARLNARQIAQHIGIGSDHVHHLVSIDGVSLDQFILQARIDAATEMLRTEDPAPLKQIARDTGFRSSDELARQMRKYLGRSPTQYHLDHRAEVAAAGEN